MKAQITVKMDNAAFADGASGTELARILRKIADECEGRELVANETRGYRDTNGNRVGSFEVTE